MTVNEVLDTLDIIKPHPFARKLLVKELERLDGRVVREIAPAGVTGLPAYDPAAGETVLLVPEPYDLLYLHYCSARIDFWNGENERYNSDVMLFTEVWNAYAAWVSRTRSGGTGKRLLM